MPEPTQTPIHSPHDKFFKETFSYCDVAAELFQTWLPAPLTAGVDWTSLGLAPGSFVDERLAEHFSDLMFMAQFRGVLLRLCLLLEHQSTPPPDMPLRFLGYVARAFELQQKERRRGQPPSPIVPLVLYHGVEAWTAPLRFLDWLQLPAEYREQLAPFQPDFGYLLLDLARTPMAELAGRSACRLALTLMKAAREGTLLEWLAQFAPGLAELRQQPEKVGTVRTMLRYLLQTAVNVNYSTIEEQFARLRAETVRGDLMSVAEELIQKGEQRGWQKGEQEGLMRGRLIGRIQICQDLLLLPVTAVDELRQKVTGELQALLDGLEAQVRQRVS